MILGVSTDPELKGNLRPKGLRTLGLESKTIKRWKLEDKVNWRISSGGSTTTKKIPERRKWMAGRNFYQINKANP